MTATGPIVLIDVDETLIDTHYELNVPLDDLRAALARAAERGITVGLNSDSALATLDRRAREFGIRGPLIGERGACLVLRPEESVIEVDAVATSKFLGIRRAFVAELASRAVTGILCIVGDVNDLANALPQLPVGGCGATIAVLVDGFRCCSVSCYIRSRTADGRWTRGGAALDVVIDILREVTDRVAPALLPSWDLDANPAYGIAIVHHPATAKSRAVRHLRAIVGARPVLMIGNSMADFLDDPQVVQWAVGNAKWDYRARCAHVAEAPLTAGVIELLDRIV